MSHYIKYSVVHNMRGPYHLFNNEIGKTGCGKIAPGLESRCDDAICDETGYLYDATFGASWPENPEHFCKVCLKALRVNVKETQKAYNNKFAPTK